MTLMTQSGFAKHIGPSRQYVSQMKINGHLVMNGDQVDAERSIARMESLKDPVKQGVEDRHEQERKSDKSQSSNIIIARREKQLEIEEERHRTLKRENDLADGKLMVTDEARAAVADGDAIIRNRLESLPDVLAPQLAAETDEQKIRAVLMDYVEGMLMDLSRSFNRMVNVNE